jgi:hypothetical protein
VRRIIGIDPGLTGGIAALDVDGDQLVLVGALATPTLTTRRNGKVALDYDVRAMYRVLADLVGDAPATCVIVLEQVSTRPEEHRGRVLQTGKGWGLWRGLIGCFAVEYQAAVPQVWKKRQQLIGLGKQASVLRAKEKFPALARLTRTQHGIAEAALIAATMAGR